MPRYLTQPPSGALRRSARSATRSRAARRPPRARVARSARSHAPARPGERGAPGLAELPLDPVANDGRSARLRNGQAETRLFTPIFTREPVQHEKAGRDRAALPVDGVEIAGTAEPMSALHRRTLGRETLPAAGSPALQDRAAGARRHPRAKAVAALPPTHVWLIGPLQGRCKEGEKRGVRAMPSGQYRRASSTELSTGPARD